MENAKENYVTKEIFFCIGFNSFLASLAELEEPDLV